MPPASSLRGSYSYNGWGAFASWDSTLGLGNGHTHDYPNPAVPESRVIVPSAMYAIADARILSESVLGVAGGAPVMFTEAGYPEASNSLAGRHGKGYNVLLCDNHIELVKRRVLTNSVRASRFFNIDNESHL